MKKPKKLLTNEHLLKEYHNNFSLAEAAIALAYSDLEKDKGFSLKRVLDDVSLLKKKETSIETKVKIEPAYDD